MFGNSVTLGKIINRSKTNKYMCVKAAVLMQMRGSKWKIEKTEKG
jgi:hypothetical protein